MKRFFIPLAMLTFGAWFSVAHAEIYKRIDENGHITYSNVPIKGAKKLNLDPVDPNSNPRGANPSATKVPSPPSFPKVDNKTQNQRDNKRREILTQELDSEKKALEESKKALEEGKNTPEVFRGAGGKTFRNVQRYEEKVQKLQEDVDAHQKNIELLEKEIDSVE